MTDCRDEDVGLFPLGERILVSAVTAADPICETKLTLLSLPVFTIRLHKPLKATPTLKYASFGSQSYE